MTAIQSVRYERMDASLTKGIYGWIGASSIRSSFLSRNQPHPLPNGGVYHVNHQPTIRRLIQPQAIQSFTARHDQSHLATHSSCLSIHSSIPPRDLTRVGVGVCTGDGFTKRCVGSFGLQQSGHRPARHSMVRQPAHPAQAA